MAIVYQHRRKDTNEVFYVGIGKEKTRAYIKSNRGQHWKNIVNKIGYNVDILFDGYTWDEACEMEKELICRYGRIDLGTGQLINLTEGGDGNGGRLFSEEHRKNISKRKKGRKLPDYHKKILSEAQKKYYAGLSDEEKRLKCTRYGMLNKKHNEESKEKTRQSLLGRTREKVVCPHCNKEGGPGGFHRYHFDNCKLKTIV
jgi:hypothetical protein